MDQLGKPECRSFLFDLPNVHICSITHIIEHKSLTQRMHRENYM